MKTTRRSNRIEIQTCQRLKIRIPCQSLVHSPALFSSVVVNCFKTTVRLVLVSHLIGWQSGASFFFNQSGLMEAKQKSNLEFFSITNWYLLFCSRLRRYIRSDGKHHLGQIRKCFLRPVAQLRALWLVYARRFPFPGFKFPLLTVCTEEEEAIT